MVAAPQDGLVAPCMASILPRVAIYHLNVTTGSRGKGQSAAAKADYLQREGKYQQQEDRCLHHESGHMPAWAETDSSDYWQAADLYERANSRLFKEVEVALPKELSREGQVELAHGFAEHLTAAEQLPYTLAIHEGRGENPHAHIMISERMNDGLERSREQWFRRANSQEPELGGALKTESLKPRMWLVETREAWAMHANAALEREGLDVRIDHRSLKDQGLERLPQIHLGPHVLEMERRGVKTERGEVFSERERVAERLTCLARRVSRLRGWIAVEPALEEVD